MKSIPDIPLIFRDQWGPADGRILYMSFWLPALAHTGKTKYKARWFSVYGLFENEKMVFVWDTRDSDARGRRAIEHLIVDHSTRARAWKEYTHVITELKKEARELEAIEKKHTDEAFFEVLRRKAKKWHDLMLLYWDYGLLCEVANYGAPAYLKKKLTGLVSENELSHALEVLLAPEKLSFHQECERELLRACLEKNVEKRKRLLSTHARRWAWVENSYFESKILTENDFVEGIRELSDTALRDRLGSVEQYPEEVKNKKSALRKKLKLPKEIVRIAQDLSFSIWWQDHRKAIAMWSISVLDIFLRSATKHFNLSYADLMMYCADEWRDLFLKRQKVPSAVIAQRHMRVVFLVDTVAGTLTEVRGKDVDKLKQTLFVEHSVEGSEQTEIKGTPVSKGKVVGTVCILLSPRNVAKMKEGDVLVTSMTEPDFIVAMRKSGAIVTDVGGLMSHAAVISRELGKPCIVGTKIATKVLKDGDEVEVNANEGVVRIIKKA